MQHYVQSEVTCTHFIHSMQKQAVLDDRLLLLVLLLLLYLFLLKEAVECSKCVVTVFFLIPL